MTELVDAWGRARPRVAFAVVRGDDPQVIIAQDDEVLARVVALHVVASSRPEALGHHVDAIRQALLDERWADAVLGWMDATGKVVDAYPDEQVWRGRDLDEEQASMELRVAPIFDER